MTDAVHIDEINAADAGSWTLGDVTVNRIGFGTKRLAGNSADGLDAAPDHAVGLLRRGTCDPAHLAENVAAGGLRLSADELTRVG